MNQSEPTAPPPGVSGKRLTLWVLAALLAIGVCLSYTLWTYNALDVARDKSSEAWRTLTEPLAQRYRVADESIARAVAAGQVDSKFSQTFHLAVDRFRTTSLPLEQAAAAEQVESLLATAGVPVETLSATVNSQRLRADIEAYNQNLQRERGLRRSLGGQILDVFLKFAEPPPFTITASPSGN